MKNKKQEIRVWDYLDGHQFIEDDVTKIVNKVFKSGRLILGRSVENFEKNFSNWNQSKYGVGVGNGTDAIKLALMAVGVSNGDEVITLPTLPFQLCLLSLKQALIQFFVIFMKAHTISMLN